MPKRNRRQTHTSGDIVADIRPALLGLAYRMLGSRIDAEDAVQDTFLRWQEADHSTIRNPNGWLTTACTRRCIDLLRSVGRQRTDYVGAWLPEAIHTKVEPVEETPTSLARSMTTAFLLMLERLSPKERAAYLLHDIFELPYPQIAEILGLKEATCRKLVSRARSNVGQSALRSELPSTDRQERLLAAFQEAIFTGNATKFANLLSEDVEIRHDTGGKVGAAVHMLQGRADVLDFVLTFLRKVWSRYRWTVAELNGAKALTLVKDGATVAAVSFGFEDSGKARHIFIQRNPGKLAGLSLFPPTDGVEHLAQ